MSKLSARLIRGQMLTGQVVTVLGHPEYIGLAFAYLRPIPPTLLPDRMRGVLVEIALDTEA